MNTIKNRKSTAFLWYVLISIVLVFSTGYAEDRPGKQEMKENIIGEVSGEVTILRLKDARRAQPNDKIFIEDIITTEKEANANILFTDESHMILVNKSRLCLDGYSLDKENGQGETKLRLDNGALKVILGKNDIIVDTPLSIAESKGSDKVLNVVNYMNRDDALKEKVRVTAGKMSCVTEGERATVPVPVTQRIVDKYGPFRMLDFIAWEEDISDEKRTFCVAIFSFKDCDQCERLNPQGKCVPDNNKPCDDGNACTIDDICNGRVCRGQRDPSPIDPACELT